MISDNDKKYLTEAGRELLVDIINKSTLRNKLSTEDFTDLYNKTKSLEYEEVVTLIFTEDIRAFESKFSKFLKYSLAAIAGMAFGGIGLATPTVAMFTLYLYRKMTDTCERSCFKKFPLSAARKICRYECQLNAAKITERKIRSEISRCNSFENPDRCEKRLQSEYIKWAKRVQQLTIKLTQVKADYNEQQRKERLAQSKRDKMKGAMESRNNFFLEEEDQELTPIKIDPQKEKMIRVVMYLGLWVVPVPFFNDLINYIAKKYSFGCAGKCAANQKMSKHVCYTQCAYLGAKYAVDFLNKQLPKCNKSKKPKKCRDKIYNLLQDWKQREVERKIKFEAALKDELKHQQLKNIKLQRKMEK